MQYFDLSRSHQALDTAQWAVVYVTVDVDARVFAKKFKENHPNVELFGVTSHQGVMTPDGFRRGAFALAGYQEDGVEVRGQLVATSQNVVDEALRGSLSFFKTLEHKPEVLMLHATPGHEEAVIEGIEAAIQKVYGEEASIPIYGGSAADDDLSGAWLIFQNDLFLKEGFLLMAFNASHPILGDFLSGYLPSKHHGKVTRAHGRIVYEIDHRPAAEVYNEWSQGAIEEALTKGGYVLGETSLKPIGKVQIGAFGIPTYLLSHPAEVNPRTKALSFFSEMKEGDEIVLMRGSKISLLERNKQLVSRALRRKDPKVIAGSLLVYCAGCVGAILDRTDEICTTFSEAVHHAPFIGLASFGEQGCTYDMSQNLHGNLMSDLLIFTHED